MFLKRLHKKRKVVKTRRKNSENFEEVHYSSSSENSCTDGDAETPIQIKDAVELKQLPLTEKESRLISSVEDLSIHPSPITCAVVVGDGDSDEMVIWFGDKLGYVYNSKVGSGVQRMDEKHAKCVGAMCYSSNLKRVITGGNDGNVFQWDASERKHFHSFERAHRSAITGLSTSARSTLLFAVSTDKKITVWSLQEQILMHSFYGPLSSIYGVSANHQECCVVVGADNIPRYYKVSQGKHNAYDPASTYIECVCFLSDNIFVCGTAQGELVVYDINKSKPMQTHNLSHSFGFVGDGAGFEQVSSRSVIDVPNAWNGNPIWSICSFSISSSDENLMFATGSCDGFIRIWRVLDGEIVQVGHAPIEGIVTSLSFSPSLKMLVGSVAKEPRNGRWNTWTTTSNRIVLLHMSSYFAP
ncbi:hypothetical protein XU18_1177 [Perkinsela sp. CCAP 1560/4]|nr:hypothetical protein XU18_1177 [Perkinsela sp. CCAP 1560/4]|eukprot:KNH08276.1 hypothetical protein XU18_1177 [Perkinsela sp. CCAP 1560/4]